MSEDLDFGCSISFSKKCIFVEYFGEEYFCQIWSIFVRFVEDFGGGFGGGCFMVFEKFFGESFVGGCLIGRPESERYFGEL